MKYLVEEIRNLWRTICAMKWSIAVVIALVSVWALHLSHLQIQEQLHQNINTLSTEIQTLEDYYVPQAEAFENTMQRIAEYIAQTDMFLNVGGHGVQPEYYAPNSYDLITNHQDLDFYELLAATELFFNSRAEYFDNIPNIWPLRYSRHMRITSPFGPRFSPFTGNIQEHEGIDMVSTYRAEILATAPGVIEEHWLYPGHPIFGRYIIINHDDRYRTHYAHLSESYVRQRLPNGERMTVERGQVIGRIGNTGRSMGAHLHYGIEVRDNETGEWVFVDPQAFLLRALGDEAAPVAVRSDD